jgi:hypothetical protein
VVLFVCSTRAVVERQRTRHQRRAHAAQRSPCDGLYQAERVYDEPHSSPRAWGLQLVPRNTCRASNSREVLAIVLEVLAAAPTGAFFALAAQIRAACHRPHGWALGGGPSHRPRAEGFARGARGRAQAQRAAGHPLPTGCLYPPPPDQRREILARGRHQQRQGAKPDSNRCEIASLLIESPHPLRASKKRPPALRPEKTPADTQKRPTGRFL